MLRDTPPPSYQHSLHPRSTEGDDDTITTTHTVTPNIPNLTTQAPTHPARSRSPPRPLPLDDVFGSDSDPDPEPPPPTTTSRPADRGAAPLPPPQEASEVPALRRAHTTAGYRDGIAASKTRHVQDGFDEGFALGAEVGLRVGWVVGGLEGCVRAMLGRGGAGVAGGAVGAAGAAGAAGEDASGAVGESGSGNGNGDESALEGARALLAEARAELAMEKMLGREWITQDGVWGWDVPGEDGAEVTTFREVAGAHPVLVRWMGVLERMSGVWGLDLRFPAVEEGEPQDG